MKKAAFLIALLMIQAVIAAPGTLRINDIVISLPTEDAELPEVEIEEASEEVVEEVQLKDIPRSYIYANGQRIAKVEKNEISFYINDHLGSPRVVVDKMGEVIEKIDYLPFGAELTKTTEKIKYTGKELDLDTDLHYFNARYYDSSIGRFITADEVETFPNPYSYVRNNPMKFIDPTGNQIFDPNGEILPAVDFRTGFVRAYDIPRKDYNPPAWMPSTSTEFIFFLGKIVENILPVDAVSAGEEISKGNYGSALLAATPFAGKARKGLKFFDALPKLLGQINAGKVFESLRKISNKGLGAKSQKIETLNELGAKLKTRAVQEKSKFIREELPKLSKKLSKEALEKEKRFKEAQINKALRDIDEAVKEGKFKVEFGLIN